MKDIIIIGAGGHGTEIAWLARRCNRNIRGFLDDTFEKQGTVIASVKVLGLIETVDSYQDCEFIIAIGSPRKRKAIVDKYFQSNFYNFATLIDPSAIIGENVLVGKGTVLCAGSIVSIDVKIGEHCLVNVNASISHGSILNDFVSLAPNVSISGDVYLHKYVEVGANAVIREKLLVNNGAVVGMGGVVISDIEENHIVVGNPAKFLKIVEK